MHARRARPRRRSRTQAERAASAPPVAQLLRDGPARRRRVPAGGRSAAAPALPGRARRGRPEAGRRCRRGSRWSLELEYLALDLDLVAGLRADVAQRSLQLLLRAGRAVDAEAA